MDLSTPLRNLLNSLVSGVSSTLPHLQVTHQETVKLNVPYVRQNSCCVDLQAALLSYRATPLANGYSPAELLMSCKLRTKVPIVQANLTAKVPDELKFRQHEESARINQKINFDSHHASKQLSQLTGGENVWIPDRKQFGTVQQEVHPRSYTVQTPTGTYRRNRVQMNRVPPPVDTPPPQHVNLPQCDTIVNPPQVLITTPQKLPPVQSPKPSTPIPVTTRRNQTTTVIIHKEQRKVI